MSTYNGAFQMSITAKYRSYYVGGALVGTATSCLFYGGIGFLIFGLGGLYGGLKLAIILAVLQLIAIEIFWFRKAGGIVKFYETRMPWLG